MDCKPGVLVEFVKRKVIIINGSLLNADSVADDVFYLLRSKLGERKPAVVKSFFIEHMSSLLLSYGERLKDADADSMLFHEVITLFAQACEGSHYDTGKSSFDALATVVDQDADTETDFMLMVGSTN